MDYGNKTSTSLKSISGQSGMLSHFMLNILLAKNVFYHVHCALFEEPENFKVEYSINVNLNTVTMLEIIKALGENKYFPNIKYHEWESYKGNYETMQM